MNSFLNYNNITCQKYSDITIVVGDLYGNIYNYKSHRIILARASVLFDDLISLMSTEEDNKLNMYLSNKEELDKFIQVIDFIYDKGEIDNSCIDCILKHQFHACAYWLLKYKLDEIDNLNDIENLYSLIYRVNLWNGLIMTDNDNEIGYDIVRDIFKRWCDFLKPFENFKTRMFKMPLQYLIKMIEEYKTENKCLDIISIFIIKWIQFNNDKNDYQMLKQLLREVNCTLLSKPIRKYWLMNIHTFGDKLLDFECNKILDLMSSTKHIFQFDDLCSNSYNIFSIHDINDVNNIQFYLNLESTFYTISIKYDNGIFSAKLNSLDRYNEEGVNFSINADININLTFNDNTHWVHITGVYRTEPFVDTLTQTFNFQLLEEELNQYDSIRVNSNAFLKLH